MVMSRAQDDLAVPTEGQSLPCCLDLRQRHFVDVDAQIAAEGEGSHVCIGGADEAKWSVPRPCIRAGSPSALVGGEHGTRPWGLRGCRLGCSAHEGRTLAGKASKGCRPGGR